MKTARNAKKEQASTVLPEGRRGWVAGLKWVPETDMSRRRFNAHPGTHRIVQGKKGNRVSGYARISKQHQRRSLYSLAAAFCLFAGDNSYGIYPIDETRWIFLASQNGQPAVMGDVVGTLDEALAAQALFLSFNDAPDGGWAVVAEPDFPMDLLPLAKSLSLAQRKQVRLVKLTSLATLAAVLLVFALGSAGAGYWQYTTELAEKEAAALARLRAEQAKARQKVQSQQTLPHPWAMMWPTPYFLSQCYFIRQPLPVSIAGWRLTAGECISSGMRLRYEARPGSTISDFDRRSQQLLGQNAVFNFLEGGKTGLVFIPFITDNEPTPWRDETVPLPGVQLMRFLSHFQRRNIDVPLSEVVPPARAPGAGTDDPVQDWHEYIFTVNSQLAPEWILTDFDDTGIRLDSITFSLSAEGQFDYQIKGHIYAQK
ncbi:type 4b pilus protein PilO2 [Pectobacterium brasiliense]|uniref:Type 4b pilus protein PilO2 n=1 Tax=Pectobacterium brasiliense TaxID=180957 RepID=A0A433NBL2_9GAMM|nr:MULTISPECIES: type 4b pilus protein PilO2 [Pectobacterium]GKW29496.1 pilus biosynthesis protein [Pectobacterium carotovorum subsp. carotovorum]MBN3048126.1 type 4b pilus protein PilO2 [Pectobacterium brasiliense]MBN3057100.1 type 4b pilus protein PilO2 [Pectobacterium brasiliense]MBN3077587.1 type 4b pilus protein PilO2 [Pectobacterium brasiliense]MBN3082057.1 type 4b pilus protein PilO2 [Pectobacterium polaris]